MYGSGRRSTRHEMNVWPGWVDALSSLIMVIIFVLMIFVLGQFTLAHTLSGRDQTLAKLNQKIADLNDLLTVERQGAADLRLNAHQLSDQLQTSLATREKLAADLASLRDERDQISSRLTTVGHHADAADADASRVGRDLESAHKAIDADRDKIELQLREIASLQADLRALRAARDKLEGEMAALATLSAQQIRTLQDQAAALSTRLDTAERQRSQLGDEVRLSTEQRALLMAQLSTLRDRAKELESAQASEHERTMLAQKDIEARDIRIKELGSALESTTTTLTETQALSRQDQARLSALAQEIEALRGQLARLSAALDAAEAKDTNQKTQITDLSGRLTMALANKVEELARYRSEFFGRLREAIGARPDIRIVGDRFVFQSEVLFPTGSATLQDGGKQQLGQLARTLLDIARTFPPEVNWILRIDGHTDPRRIATPQFPSNWELSTARAISVVKFLIDQGIPSERLAATGFGEYQPLDAGTTEDAFAHNRRIELKLDQR